MIPQYPCPRVPLGSLLFTFLHPTTFYSVTAHLLLGLGTSDCRMCRVILEAFPTLELFSADFAICSRPESSKTGNLFRDSFTFRRR